MHRRHFMYITAAGLIAGCNRVEPASARDASPSSPPPRPKQSVTPATAQCAPTSRDLRGPYWTPDAPHVAHLVPKGDLRIEGLVKGPDCTPISGATVHVWQADPKGEYAEDRLRGRMATGSDGGYRFETIRPGRYLQPSGWRPAHIHFEVTAPGYQPLISQLYFADDPYLGAKDSCGVCRSNDPQRIIALKQVVVPYQRTEGVFEIHLAKA